MVVAASPLLSQKLLSGYGVELHTGACFNGLAATALILVVQELVPIKMMVTDSNPQEVEEEEEEEEEEEGHLCHVHDHGRGHYLIDKMLPCRC